MWRRPGSTRGGDWGTGWGDVDVPVEALGPVPTRQLSLAQCAGAWRPCSGRPPPQPPLPLRLAVSSPEPLQWGRHGPRSLLRLPAPSLSNVGLPCCSSFWARWVLA